MSFSGETGSEMRSLPPWPLARSVILTACLVWAVPRTILATGAQIVARTMGVAPELSNGVLLLLNLAVVGIVYLDFRISRERVFAANLGVSPLVILFLASGTALICEILLAGVPGLLASLAGS